jgi:C4-type Zn-finger protein
MKKTLALLTLFLVFACVKKDNGEALVNEVLNIHDEVMPKIGEVMSLRKKVLDKVEGSTNPDELRDIALSLEEAQQGMMLWMNDWSKNSAPFIKNEATEEEKMNYLNAEKERVTKVKEDINNSIAKAKEALKN